MVVADSAPCADSDIAFVRAEQLASSVLSSPADSGAMLLLSAAVDNRVGAGLIERAGRLAACSAIRLVDPGTAQETVQGLLLLARTSGALQQANLASECVV